MSIFWFIVLCIASAYGAYLMKELFWPGERSIALALKTLEQEANTHNKEILPLNWETLAELSVATSTFYLKNEWVLGKSGFFYTIFGDPFLPFAWVRYRGGTRLGVIIHGTEVWHVIVRSDRYEFFYQYDMIGYMRDNEAIYTPTDKQWGQLIVENRARRTYLRIAEQAAAIITKGFGGDVVKPRAIAFEKKMNDSDRPLFVIVAACILLWNQTGWR